VNNLRSRRREQQLKILTVFRILSELIYPVVAWQVARKLVMMEQDLERAEEKAEHGEV
jgi:hypothetical protein